MTTCPIEELKARFLVSAEVYWKGQLGRLVEETGAFCTIDHCGNVYLIKMLAIADRLKVILAARRIGSCLDLNINASMTIEELSLYAGTTAKSVRRQIVKMMDYHLVDDKAGRVTMPLAKVLCGLATVKVRFH